MPHRTHRPVLVLEDHDDTRQMVEMFLRADGYDVCTAAQGLDALECIDGDAPCLIVLDVMMPVMDSRTFAQRLRESRAGYRQYPDRGVNRPPHMPAWFNDKSARWT
jgi:CheY-like chemotaxis protein